MQDSETKLTETVKNTVRDDATVGKQQRLNEQPPGLAAEDTPQWSPPESNPEPRPVEPTMTQN